MLLFSLSVAFDSLQLHGLQHARLPYRAPSPRVCSNSCPLSWRCHPTISSSVNPFSSCLQSFPANFSNELALCIRWLKYWASVSASVLMNIQGWFPLGLPGLISLQSKGSQDLLQHNSLKASVLQCSAIFMVQLSHPYMTTGKTIALTRWTFVRKVMSAL